MDYLETCASRGVHVKVEWFHEEDDDITKEFVEDVTENYKNMKLILTPNLS
jgi:hypothetical protein